MYVAVDERCVRITDDLAIGVVFHHDHKNVIEMLDASRDRSLGCKHRSCQCANATKQTHCAFSHVIFTFRELLHVRSER
jgi:hypothetical protein